MIVLFNKPYQVLSQFTTDSDKSTLADYIDISGVYPAGRLDYDSEGLMLLTDDGRLQARITDAGIAYDIRAMEKPSDHCPSWVDFD